MLSLIGKFLRDPNETELKKLWPLVRTVREFQAQPAIANLTLEQIPGKTQSFRDRLAAGETLDDVAPEAFALLCHTCSLIKGKKVSLGKQEFGWEMLPFDVQILGGFVLHRGCIAEMKTGEGKTLVCTFPVYLNALAGKGVHVVTVNDYLAKRDSTWMGLLYEALGLTVGTIVHDLNGPERRAAYACDVTYGTNNEFGFDYLRDNMVSSVGRQVQRGLHYAIVDEVDSILIDEARTPLIISQPEAESTQKYMQHAQLVRQLQAGTHYTKDEKQRVATLTEEGITHMEQLLGVQNIYTDRGFEEVHHIEQALRAHAIYQADVDYVVKPSSGSGQGGEIIIVDEFTGRLMPGRRYGHGLHQAIEAKEGVAVQRESKTLATITFQNYFRLYVKLAGMTGTAKTEEEEFESIYKLRTIVIPTHRPVKRADGSDAVYRTVLAKFTAVAKIAKEKHAKGQPVLIGTTSIEKSEALSRLLTDMQVPHEVLNAKHHEREAEIVAQAGQRGAVTIATNMAGRGTDIKLGEGIPDVGGLSILGTERHEARRIDNQLRGRSGRQGDPGESLFFVSMEDELMRLFGGEQLKSLMQKLNVPDDVPLENSLVSRSIEGAQKRVEGRNFDIRRHVVQYDDILNKHRDIIYKRRQKILVRLAEQEAGQAEETPLLAQPLHEDVRRALVKETEAMMLALNLGQDPGEWNLERINEVVAGLHPELMLSGDMQRFADAEALKDHLESLVLELYESKCASVNAETVAQAERVVTLRAIDTHWMEHIDTMAHLREQVAFSGYAQRDPLIEYKDQGFRRFQQLLATIESTIARVLLQADLRAFQPQIILQQADEDIEDVRTNEGQITAELEETGVTNAPVSAGGDDVLRVTSAPRGPAKPLPKVGRNDECPCGSGKKYKKCHGQHE